MMKTLKTKQSIQEKFSGFLFVLMSLTLTSCASWYEEPLGPDIHLHEINISLDSDANVDSATSIDLVVVYHKDLLKALMGMKSEDYFASKDQIKRDYPEMVDIWHWELTPSQAMTKHQLSLKSDAVGAFVFADYLTPGVHRVRLGSEQHIHVRLKRDDFCVLEQGCAFEYTGKPPRATDQAQQSDAIKGAAKKAVKAGSAQQDVKKVAAGAKKLLKF